MDLRLMEITYHVDEFSVVFLVSEFIKHIVERATLTKTFFKSVDHQTRRSGPKDTCEILRKVNMCCSNKGRKQTDHNEDTFWLHGELQVVPKFNCENMLRYATT